MGVVANLTLYLLLFVLLLGATSAQKTPTHVYLSLTGDITQVQLTFTTTASPSSAIITYNTVANPTKKLKVVATSSDTFNFVTPFGVQEYITSVTLKSLIPATEYSYAIVVDSISSTSHTFRSLPAADDPVSILMYGDLGSLGSALLPSSQAGITAMAASHKMDFIVHYGDLAYNLATNNGAVGELFMRGIASVSASYPYIVLAGNHEYADNNQDEAMFRGWFRGQIPLGQNSKSPDPGMWHSYDIGDKLHLIGINTEVYCEDTQHLIDQWNWLKKDLENVQARANLPWVIVYGHRQMYEGRKSYFHTLMMRQGVQCDDEGNNCDFSQPCDSGDCQYSLEDLFHKYNIDLYIAGHHHSYNRMFPISHKGKFEDQANDTYLNPANPVYIVSGAAGAQTVLDDEDDSDDWDLNKSPVPTAVKNPGYSLSLLTVYNDTHLKFEQTLTTGETIDEFWMVKDNSEPLWDVFTSFSLKDANNTGVCT